MSAQNKKGVVAAQSTGIVVGDGKHHRQRIHVHIKLIGLVVGCLVVLGLICWGGVVLLGHLRHSSKVAQSPRRTPTSTQSVLTPDLSKKSPEQKAEYYLLVDDYASAYKIYENQLKSAKSDSDKAELYGSMATVALDAKDYQRALSYEKQADALDPTSASAKAVGYAAQVDGDKKTAAHYYQLAIDRFDRSRPNSERAFRELQADLQEVQQ